MPGSLSLYLLFCVLMSTDQAEPIMRNNFTHMILDGSFLGGKANIYMETKYRTDLEVCVINKTSLTLQINENDA